MSISHPVPSIVHQGRRPRGLNVAFFVLVHSRARPLLIARRRGLRFGHVGSKTTRRAVGTRWTADRQRHEVALWDGPKRPPTREVTLLPIASVGSKCRSASLRRPGLTPPPASVMAGRPRKKEKRAVFSIDVTVPVSAIKPHLDLRWIKAVDVWSCECRRTPGRWESPYVISS
jgi:hypothetical protein